MDEQGRKHGVILNGHRPPTMGHYFMSLMGLDMVDVLHLGVCSLTPELAEDPKKQESEKLDGRLRYLWTKKMLAGEAPPGKEIRVYHCHDMPTHFDMSYGDNALWGRVVNEFMGIDGNIVDFLFASEVYGPEIARAISRKTKYFTIDPSRSAVNVSGTAVRENPMDNWKFIPDCVRPFYAKRVVVIGAEYTGKRKLSRALGKIFDTHVAQEYASVSYDPSKGPVTRQGLIDIAHGQKAGENALVKMANKVMICDTDILTTRCHWDERVARLGPCPKWIDEEAKLRDADLYLFLDIKGMKHKPSNTHPHRDQWVTFSQRIKRSLDDLGRNYLVLQGNYNTKLKTAEAAVTDLITNHQQPRIRPFLYSLYNMEPPK